MESNRYLIIGAGLTADSACKAIREHDPEGSVLVIGEESHPPYLRPPLSKALWKGEPEERVWRGTETLGVELLLGRRAVAIDLDARTVTDDAGERHRYERLLLATGGRPRRLPFGGEEVVYFRTLDDYRRLRGLAGGGRRVCVIGGGFIGSEIAAVLALNDCVVTIVFPEPGIGARLFPPELSAALNDYYRDRDVDVRPQTTVTAIDRHGETVQVGLGDGSVIEPDVVVAGIGIVPNVELAANAGLPTPDGITVDVYGRVGGRDDVFAAGDVARFPATALGRELRVEHEDHAKSHGRLVGANMAGASERYDHLPFFYSDLFDVGYEAVGELDPRLDMLVEWSEPEAEGTITYLDQERRPRGLLLWNRFGHLDAARELIRAGEPVAEHVQVE
jgi:NADPH-dependent 2,4-dienoyl-CoA reductase/sulfur reductase-like enzyme